MTNEEACAYAVVAASMIPQQLRQDDTQFAVVLYIQMIGLMDMYTEAEILAKMRNLIGQEDR